MWNAGVVAVATLLLSGATSVYAAAEGKKIEQQSLSEFVDQPLPKGVSYYVTDDEVIMVSAEDGRTLYLVNYFEGQENYYEGYYTQLFYRPLQPEPGESTMGNWDIVDYWNGGKQWTYNGKLVMVYRRDVVPGEISALEARQLPVTPLMKQIPKPEVAVPPEFSLDRVKNQWVITDFSGKALYRPIVTSESKEEGFRCDENCQKTWVAVSAPSLLPKDTHYHDWTIVPGADGVPQWAYAGSPVYRSASDKGLENISENADGWSLITVPDVEFVIDEDKLLSEKIANR